MKVLTGLIAAILFALPLGASAQSMLLLGAGKKTVSGGSVPVLVSSTISSAPLLNSTVSCTANKPASVAVGDTLVFFYLAASTGNPTAVGNQATATLIRQRTDLSSGFYYQIAAYYRIADGSETSTFTMTETATGATGCSLVISRITGANATTPIDVSNDSLITAATTTPTAASVTTTAANDLLMVYAQGAAASANGASGWATTASSGFTMASGSVLNDTGNLWYIGAESKTQAATGATGTITVPFTGTVNSIFQAITLAIKP